MSCLAGDEWKGPRRMPRRRRGPRADGPTVRISYGCSCREPWSGGLRSDRCRRCAGRMQRRHLTRGGWWSCNRCRRETRGTLDARRCRACAAADVPSPCNRAVRAPERRAW